jgi:putative ABC transport system permease protein
MMNPLPVVLADIRHSRGGCIAVVCLIAVAVALGVAVSAQERALRQGSARAADAFDLLIGAPGSQTQLVLTSVYLQPAALPLMPGGVLRRLHEEPNVAYAAPIAFGDSFRGYPVVGSTVDFLSQGGRTGLAEGRAFATHHEVVIGADVALRLGDRFAPVHGEPRSHGDEDDEDAHLHEGFEYAVVGRMARLGTPWDRAIIAPVEAVWVVHGLPDGHAHGTERIGPPWDAAEVPGVPAILVKPKSVADAYRLRGKYRTGGTMALFPAEVLVELYTILGDARDLLAAIAVATQALVIVAILLAVFASLALRRRQLAVLRALGASRRYVLLAVWTHVSILIALGAGLGLVLGWLGAVGLSHLFLLKTGIVLPVMLGLSEIGIVLAVVAIGATLAAIPSWSSYRQSVSSALRA